MISAHDVDNIYKVPLAFRAEGVDDIVLDHFGMEAPSPDLAEWEAMVRRADAASGEVRIAIVGKYVQLADAYKSVIEALEHGGIHHGVEVEIELVDSENLDPEALEGCDGILIPGGFGERGIEGKIAAARIARERSIPYLGICLGMQIAVVEFARHVVGMDGANSAEFDPETPYPVVDLLPEQKEVSDMGGTMRLGADPVKLHEGTQGARDLRRGGHLQAPPPPLRGQQPAAAPARRRGPGLRRHLARRAPGRDDRAARPPVLRRLPVPPGVQLAAEPARAAVPRVRRRRRAPRRRTRPPTAASSRCRPRSTSSDVGVRRAA